MATRLREKQRHARLHAHLCSGSFSDRVDKPNNVARILVTNTCLRCGDRLSDGIRCGTGIILTDQQARGG